MKFLALGSLVLAFATTSFAASDMNIKAGNWQMAGSLAVNSTSPADQPVNASLSDTYSSYMTVAVAATPLYFVMDHLGVGLDLAYAMTGERKYTPAGGVERKTANSLTAYSVGPSLKYYFYTMDKFAFYVGDSFLFSKISQDAIAPTVTRAYPMIMSNQFRLGFNYFLTPAVSFGPALQFDSQFDAGDKTNAYAPASPDADWFVAGSTTLGVVAQFTINL